MASSVLRPDGTAVIIGAPSGFGRELSLLCAAEGMRLVLADTEDVELLATQTLLCFSRGHLAA